MTNVRSKHTNFLARASVGNRRQHPAPLTHRGAASRTPGSKLTTMNGVNPMEESARSDGWNVKAGCKQARLLATGHGAYESVDEARSCRLQRKAYEAGFPCISGSELLALKPSLHRSSRASMISRYCHL